MDEMRCILVEARPFMERFTDEFDVPLLQIPYAAVDEFGAAARGGFCKVVLLEKECFVSACRGINGATETRCSSTNDDHIPLMGVERLDEGAPVHVDSHVWAHSMALAHLRRIFWTASFDI